MSQNKNISHDDQNEENTIGLKVIVGFHAHARCVVFRISVTSKQGTSRLATHRGP